MKCCWKALKRGRNSYNGKRVKGAQLKRKEKDIDEG
jgi:hypothetical protein